MGYNKERYRTLKNIAYHVLFVIWYIVSCLPLWVLYLLSNLISFILYYVIRYRRKVVRKNISESYPNLSRRKRWLIERRFYTHFCDISGGREVFSFQEGVDERMQFRVLMVEDRAEGVIRHNLRTMAIGRPSSYAYVDYRMGCGTLYHPLENLVTDRLIYYTRQRFGGISIPANQSIRELVKYQKLGKPLIIGFVADQTPWWRDIHYWTNFLNHPDTPVFTGAERIMKKFDMDVYYLDIRRIRRGKYVAEYKRITTTPKECPEFWITEQYNRMMEKTINRAPSYWLWSHNRWKRTKEEWKRITGEK